MANHDDELNATLRGDQDTLDAVLDAIDQRESDPARHLSIQIDRSIREAVQAAQEANKAADVTLKIKIIPENDRRIVFSASVKATLPRPPAPAVTLFADKNGNLFSSDPAQSRFDLEDPRHTTKPPRKSEN